MATNQSAASTAEKCVPPPPVPIFEEGWNGWMRCIGVDAHKEYAYVVELHDDDTVKEYRVELDE